MSRNVTIVIVILILVALAGYLVWLRNQFQSPVSPQTREEVVVSPSPSPVEMASPSAQASPSATPKSSPKTATSGAGVR